VAKQLKDLPHFRVEAVKRLRTHDGETVDFEIRGTLDRINGVCEGSCWLLLPERGCLMADLNFEDVGAKKARLVTLQQTIPSLIGLSAPYLSGRWEPYHVWMVIEPEWIWSRAFFQVSDAMARSCQEEGVPSIDGREVKEWIEIRKVGEENNRFRVYPVFSNGESNLPAVGPDGIIKGGWNHEHCDICNSHIESGQYEFRDLGGHTVCERCHFEYVIPHDLSFLERF
jgi:hypothetical protein